MNKDLKHDFYKLPEELLDTLTYASMVDIDAKLTEDSTRLQIQIPMGVFIG